MKVATNQEKRTLLVKRLTRSRRNSCYMILSVTQVAQGCHFERAKNLLYTSKETKSVFQSYTILCRAMTNIFKPETHSIIKTSKPWKGLSMDFKGPVKEPRPYFFTVVDELCR